MKTAESYLKKAQSLGSDTPEASANLGLLALIAGDTQDAEAKISKASGSENVSLALGALNIAKGNYAQQRRTSATATQTQPLWHSSSTRTTPTQPRLSTRWLNPTA